MSLFDTPDPNAARLRAAGWTPYGPHSDDPATWPKRQWTKRKPDGGYTSAREDVALATLDVPAVDLLEGD